MLLKLLFVAVVVVVCVSGEAAWPCRKGNPERTGYQPATLAKTRYEQFQTPISDGTVCGSTKYAKVNDLAMMSSGNIAASNGENVMVVDTLGVELWRFSSKTFNTTYSNNQRCLFFTSPVVGNIGNEEVVFVGTGNPIAQLPKYRGDLPLFVFALVKDTVKWSTSLVMDNPKKAKVVSCTSVVLTYDSQYLYVACNFDQDVVLYKLEASSGKILLQDSRSFLYPADDPPVTLNMVGELLVSKNSEPGAILFTTEYQFFKCIEKLTPSPGRFVCQNTTYPEFASSYRIAEGDGDTVIVYSYDSKNNTILTLDLNTVKFQYTQPAADSKYDSDGSLSTRDGDIYALEKNQLVKLNSTLNAVWISTESINSSPGSGIVVDDERVYTYDLDGDIKVFTQDSGKFLGKIEAALRDPPMLNFYKSPALGSGPKPALLLPSLHHIISLSLGNLGQEILPSPSTQPLEPSLSGGTIAAMVICASLIGCFLFVGVYYFNSQREAFQRLPILR